MENSMVKNHGQFFSTRGKAYKTAQFRGLTADLATLYVTQLITMGTQDSQHHSGVQQAAFYGLTRGETLVNPPLS